MQRLEVEVYLLYTFSGANLKENMVTKVHSTTTMHAVDRKTRIRR